MNSSYICLTFDYETINWQVFSFKYVEKDTTGDWVTGVTSFYVFSAFSNSLSDPLIVFTDFPLL